MTVVLLRDRASRRQFYWNGERPPQRRLAKKTMRHFMLPADRRKAAGFYLRFPETT